MTTVEDVVSLVLTGARQPLRATTSARTAWTDVATEAGSAFARAVNGGVRAPTPGYAFAIGYEAALHAMVPSLDADEVVSLCVTEAGGGHPKAIALALHSHDDGTFDLVGAKRWSTMAAVADTLWVLAHGGTDGTGRKAFRLVRVPSRRAGITRVAMPVTPFAPEVPHSEVTFAHVAVSHDEVFEGDGFERYVKPFRTYEDVHVVGALLAWLAGVWVRAGSDRAVVERLVSLIGSLAVLAMADATRAETHVALAGTLSLVHATIEWMEPGWPGVPPELQALWQRDRPLLAIANGVREQRTTRAWRTLFPTEPT